MFNHEERDVSDDEDDDGSEVERVGENDVDEGKEENDLIQITDLEPSLKKVEEAMNKVNILL
jgi:hypothetical protein